ncbi:phosphoribosyltransferase [Streptosporangium canum]|uniref:phosphoribosyltransferase n=1 Tax=Streptosporangium canum TaxID=324952 RepID=UPI0037A00AAC
MPPSSTGDSPAPSARQRVFDHQRIWQVNPEVFAAAAELLAAHEKPHRPDVVIAIARGGIPLGRALSRLLEVPMISVTLRHNHDDGLKVQATGRVDIIDSAELDQVTSGSRVLVVDDICGTGATLSAVAPLLQQRLGSVSVRTVVLCRNAASHDLEGVAGPDAWLWNTRDWVIFPWNDPTDMPTEALALPTSVLMGQEA